MRRHRCKSHVSLIQWLRHAPDSFALSCRNIQENQLALHRLCPTAERHVGSWDDRLGVRFGSSCCRRPGAFARAVGDTGVVGGGKRCGGWRTSVAHEAAAGGV
jgi:hypothetical protein